MTDKNIIQNTYETYDNYKVIKTKAKTGRAIVFFSGNGLYQDEEDFKKNIIQMDKYHWKNIAQNKKILKYYDLIVLIRDIKVQWYVEGINKNINSVDKIIELISELTKNYSLTTCGVSSGGYMASLVGAKLGAEKIYSVSGQYKIDHQSDKEPFIEKFRNNENVSKYYCITPYLSSENKIIYFYPDKFEDDIFQHSFIKDFNFVEFMFDDDEHALPRIGVAYPKLLTMSYEELKILANLYKGQAINKKVFVKRLTTIFDRLSAKIQKKFRKSILKESFFWI